MSGKNFIFGNAKTLWNFEIIPKFFFKDKKFLSIDISVKLRLFEVLSSFSLIFSATTDFSE